jgi:hypothetical protein
VVVAAILRFDAPAFHLMKVVMQCVRSMIVGLICVNYIHSVGETTFHILRINAGSGMMNNLSCLQLVSHSIITK